MCVYTCIYIYIYVYTYTYIEREREILPRRTLRVDRSARSRSGDPETPPPAIVFNKSRLDILNAKTYY